MTRSGLIGESREHFVSRWLFLRLLGLVYLFAFLSLFGQVAGLIGPNGVMPADRFLAEAHREWGGQACWMAPTVFWFGAGALALKSVCLAGCVGGLLVALDVAAVFCLPLCWALYLSLMSTSGGFLNFQWDSLLLETGFLAVFLSNLRLKPRLRDATPPSLVVIWLFRLLLFRLMFSSGWVKLTSGDLSWRHLTALRYHYETQPLPLWTSWYVHHLPPWWQTFSVAAVLFIELVVPFLIFGPKKIRSVGCWILAALQFLIMATGNFGFFNPLSMALCFAAMDDAAFPARLRRALTPSENDGGRAARAWPAWVIVPVAALLLTLSAESLYTQAMRVRAPGVLTQACRVFEPYCLVNHYGLFAVMTTTRMEIIIEGSNDGVTWVPYEFRYKPGDPNRRPALVAPFQPRLDWQMWFAALGTFRDNPWFINLCVRLLQGSPDVLGLLGRNPFAGAPPRFIRASAFEYHFSNPEVRRNTGAWWVRGRKGLYCPSFSLQDVEGAG